MGANKKSRFWKAQILRAPIGLGLGLRVVSSMVQGFRLSAVWAVLVLEEGALTIRIGFMAGGFFLAEL